MVLVTYVSQRQKDAQDIESVEMSVMQGSVSADSLKCGDHFLRQTSMKAIK